METNDLHLRKLSKDGIETATEEKEFYDDDEKQKKETTGTLTTNVFSLIYISELKGDVFKVSLCFAIFQITMLCLVLADAINPNDADNPLSVPINASITVRIAAVMSLSLSVACFWDFMDAVEKLLQTPPKAEEYPGATPSKYYLAFILQLVVGFLFLILIFILVVQSTSVVGMFLNFAALGFVIEVDDIAFGLAAKGYVGRNMKKECVKVEHFKMPQAKSIILRRFVYLMVTFLLFAFYIVICIQQITGKYDCRKIEVQFGEGFVSYLPVFSGFYKYHNKRYDGRPIYKDEEGKAIFRYCYSGKSGYWAFGVMSNSLQVYDISDLCKRFIVRSPYTSGYGLLDIPVRDWLIKKEERELEYVVDYLNIRCADCDKTTCAGSCQENICVCGDGYYGQRCQFSTKPCPLTDYNRNTSPFKGAGILYSSKYTLMEKSDGKAAFAYGKPLYAYFYPADATWAGWADILMSFGRRYNIYSVNVTGLFPNSTNVSIDLANHFEEFHPYYDWWEDGFSKITIEKAPLNFTLPKFISTSIDIGTITDSISPMGLSWYLANEDDQLTPGIPIDTVLLCAECDGVDYTCTNSGVCNNETKTCNCTNGFKGPKCEKEPPCILTDNCNFSGDF